MKPLPDIHPICYFDMIETELEQFKRLREMTGDKKQDELSRTSNDEVNKEIQLISKLERSSLISFKYAYP